MPIRLQNRRPQTISFALSLFIIAAGSACYYSPGLMPAVAARRHLTLNGYVGAVALRDRQWCGEAVWLQLPDGQIEGPFRVVDWWNPEGGATPQGWAVDVDYSTWRRWLSYRQTTGSGPLPNVRVLYSPSYREPFRVHR